MATSVAFSWMMQSSAVRRRSVITAFATQERNIDATSAVATLVAVPQPSGSADAHREPRRNA